MTGTETIVQGHYGRGGILQRLEAALKATGKDPQKPSIEDLQPYDQLHGRGIVATRELARHASLRSGTRVLDLGFGIGGASRYLTHEHQCVVSGLDLTPEFVEVARTLSERCGLGGRIEFREGNALSLPYKDASFDCVWCHNVTMNIPDKPRLAAEVARVLVRGGRFVCAEAELGPKGEPIFPLPWARDPSSSFLVTPAEMRAALEGAGLRILETIDETPAILAFRNEMAARTARGEPPLMRNDVAMGETDFAERARNMQKATGEGRIVEHIIVAEKI
ncbi:MAG TPA: methyltransferase domain-containing protein [Stellaceae bacterium]|nr:methyltransferase domain-containing protein [Stellaceae bacterium]